MAYTELDPAIAWLAHLETGLDNLGPFMAEVAQHIVGVSKASFDNQAAPRGAGWKSLAPATVADRERQGYGPVPILVREGSLRESIRAVVDMVGSSASIGSDLVYAAVHQYGSSDRPKVPARPFLGLAPESEAFIWKALEAHLQL